MSIIRYISYGISFFFIIGFIECVYKKVFKHEEGSLRKIGYESIVSIFGGIKEKTVVLICFVAIIASLFSNEGFLSIIGVQSLKTMVDGRYCYYVKITDSNGLTNTFPAQIRVDHESRDKIIILEAVCTNDNYLVYFDEQIVYPDKINHVTDENENEWDIELTSNKSESKYLKYSNNTIKGSIVQLVILGIQILSALFYLLVVMTHHERNEQSE